MRQAFAKRDIAAVYKLLIAAGISQRAIAQLTSQSQSEVSEILAGRRVINYDLLVRIADGLGVPRSTMGLAYAEDSPPAEEVGEDVWRRRFLAAASLAAVGRVVLGDPQELPEPTAILVPFRLGTADVSEVKHATVALRAQGRARGGQGMIASATATEYTRLMSASMTEPVRRSLGAVLAELHTVAGYCCYDSGRLDWAQHHFGHAVRLGREAHAPDLVADALRQGGLAVQHAGHPNDALKLYQLGQHTAAGAESPKPGLASKLSADAAMALAELDRGDLAASELARARDCATSADPFQRAGIDMITARVHARLGNPDRAEPFAAAAVATFDARHRRAASSVEITLATLHVQAGEPDGPALAHRAIEGVAATASVRARQRLRPLAAALAARRDSTCQELAQRVWALQGAQAVPTA